MGAAIHDASSFMAVADNSAAAMLATWGESVDGALETIKVMGDSVHKDLERLVIFVSADFTCLASGVERGGRLLGEFRLQNAG